MIRSRDCASALGAFFVVLTLGCATGAHEPSGGNAPASVAAADSLELYVSSASLTWQSLEWTLEQIRADTNKYTLKPRCAWTDHGRECWDENKISDEAEARNLARDQLKADYSSTMKQIRTAAHVLAPAPWADSMVRCSKMRASGAAITCLKEGLALRPAPAAAPIDQLGDLIESAGAALDTVRSVEHSIRAENDVHGAAGGSGQTSYTSVGTCISDPENGNRRSCTPDVTVYGNFVYPDSSVRLRELTAQRDSLDRRIKATLNAIRSADYSGVPRAWSKRVIECATEYRDIAVRCLNDAWRERPAEVELIGRDSTPASEH